MQDYEPWFFPAGSLATFAEETYRFGFTGITAGTWLADMLHRDFGMTTHAVSFSYDRELYRVLPRKNPETKNIFFYARPNTARRSFELGVLVLAEVAKRHPDAIAVLAGADLSGYEIPFKHTNPGIVDLADLPALYAQCDVGLVLSFSNLSLLPLELMACGVPVVSNRAPCTEWLLSDEIALLERPTVLALANAICTVLENPQEAQRLRAAGLKASAATDWAAEGMKMGKVLQTWMPHRNRPPDRSPLRERIERHSLRRARRGRIPGYDALPAPAWPNSRAARVRAASPSPTRCVASNG